MVEPASSPTRSSLAQPASHFSHFILIFFPFLIYIQVTYKYGAFCLYVGEELFNILKKYFEIARPIIAGTALCRDWDPLIIVKVK